MDLVQRDENRQLSLDQTHEYYPGYDREVLAVADGTFVTVFNEIPEKTRAGQRYPINVGVIFRKHGLRAVTAGNHVILDHGNGECSLHAHFIKDTIVVKQGQVIR